MNRRTPKPSPTKKSKITPAKVKTWVQVVAYAVMLAATTAEYVARVWSRWGR